MGNIKAAFTGFNYMEASVVEEIMRNVRTFLATPAGTCAGDRSYGIDWSFVDLGRPDAQNQLSLEVIDKLEEYEPRVEVIDEKFSSDHDGQLKALFVIAPNEEYFEEMEEDADNTESDDE